MTQKKDIKEYFKCECGSENFIRMYNVFNEKIKVKINKDKTWEVEEHGGEKKHLLGFICANCRKNADKLNDAL